MVDKKYSLWVISGEASGDIYGASLMEEIKKSAAAKGDQVELKFMGGPKMQQVADVEMMVDSSELGVVGVVEVFKHIFTFIALFKKLVAKARDERPDAVVLIDYPGFNLRFARELKKMNIKVIWYISPHVWAWKKKRIYKLAKFCRKMLVIFPFEVDIYKTTCLPTEYVGHPLVDIVKARADKRIKRDPNKVVLLPGSRANEIERLLVPMLGTAAALNRRRPELQFIISAPREKVYHHIKQIYEQFRKSHPDCPECLISYGETERWQQEAGTGLAASGTVTVESAIAGLPLVSVYKLNPLTFLMAMVLISLFRGFFTMVNIIAAKAVFEEFVQHQVTPKNLSAALERILPGGERRKEVEKEMENVVEQLSVGSASAAQTAADACYRTMVKD